MQAFQFKDNSSSWLTSLNLDVRSPARLVDRSTNIDRSRTDVDSSLIELNVGDAEEPLVSDKRAVWVVPLVAKVCGP